MNEQELITAINDYMNELASGISGIIDELNSTGISVDSNAEKLSVINKFFETRINSGIEKLRIYDLEFPIGI